MQYQGPGQCVTTSQELQPLPYPLTLFTYYNLTASQVHTKGGGLSGVKNFAPAGNFSKFNYTYYWSHANNKN